MRWIAAISLLFFASLACNLERVIDPSLPSSTAEPSQILATQAPDDQVESEIISESQSTLEVANKAFFYGDWPKAFDEFQEQFESNVAEEVQSEALLGMARVQIKESKWTEARRLIAQLQSDYPNTIASDQSFYFLALVNEQLGNFTDAANAYDFYLIENESAIASYIFEWQGDALSASGDYPAAITAYQNANQNLRLADNDTIQVKIGDTYYLAADYSSAILTYQTVYLNSSNDYLKSQMDLSMGRSYIALKQPSEAFPLYLDAVENYPLAFSSYAALVELVLAGEAVNEFDRGLVDYYAATSLEASGDIGGAAELYGVAIAAFDRYILGNADNHDSTVHHFRALSLRALDDYEGAIQEWEGIIVDHDFQDYWVEAHSQKSFTEWAYQDNFDQGIASLLSFVATTPSQARAAEFLFTAGQIAERDFQLEYAIELFQRVSLEYANSSYAYRALFKSAINSYRLGENEAAESGFRRAYAAAINLEDQSQALFWVAKIEAINGNRDQSNSSYELVSQIDPSGYYSERAADILSGIAPFSYANQVSFEIDLEREKLEAEDWLRAEFNIDEQFNLSGLGPFSQDERFLRGAEFWGLGEFELARSEFEGLRLTLLNDPIANYQMANYFIEIGLFRSGIFAARQVLSIAGLSDAESLNAPIYFNRIRFGSYFAELVNAETANNNLDALFVYSVMRQESLFEGFVTSSAGARGLMQIIPSTGQEIAELAAWPDDYTSSDLYRPLISITFGSNYLERQKNNFDGDLYRALAAYNAGPGWSAYWSSLSNNDLDLFIEVIHFPESQDYVRSIYELFSIYVEFYSINP